MKSYFPIFVTVTLLSFLAEFGNSNLRVQRDEFLPIANFEPFVYALFLATGFARVTPWLARLPARFIDVFMLPFAAALTGWGSGLTLMVLCKGQFHQVMFGLCVTLLMAAISYAPIFVVRQVISIQDQIFARMFRTWAEVLFANGLAVYFLGAGLVGLWGLYAG